jgi:hypothetical protein
MAANNDGIWKSFGAFLGFGPEEDAPSSNTPQPRSVFKKPTRLSPQDAALADAKAQLKGALSEIEREVTSMKRGAAKRVKAIRERVERGETEQARIEASDLVRTRQSIYRVERGCERMRTIDQNMQVMRTNAAVAKMAQTSVNIMISLNTYLMPQSKVMTLAKDLQVQTDELNAKNELIEEALDDAFEDNTDWSALGDAYSEKTIFDQICTECGIEQAASLPTVPGRSAAGIKINTDGARTAVPQTAGTENVNTSSVSSPDPDVASGANTSENVSPDADLADRLARLNNRDKKQ